MEEWEKVGEEEEEGEEEEMTLGHQMQGPPDHNCPEPHVLILTPPFPPSPPGPHSLDLQPAVVVAVQTPAEMPSCVTVVRTHFSSLCAKTVPTRGVSSTSATAGAATSFCGQISQTRRGRRRVRGLHVHSLHQGPPSLLQDPLWGSRTHLEGAEGRKGAQEDKWVTQCVTVMRQQ